MKIRTYGPQDVHFDPVDLSKSPRCPGRAPHPRIIHLPLLVIGLLSLAGCLESEKEPTRLEMTLDSQALQMAALSDRLARCEHQWQVNADEQMRYNQVTMRDLNAFREEQTGLRGSIDHMEERWSTQLEYLRNRQGQFQQGLVEVNRSLQATDARIMTVNHSLKERIDTAQREMSADLEALGKSAAACNERIDTLRDQTETIGTRVAAVQTEQDSLRRALAADNKALSGQLQAVAQTQSDLGRTLGQTQASAQTAVRTLRAVDGKQDRLLEWTEVSRGQADARDLSAAERHASLNAQIEALAARIEARISGQSAWQDERARLRLTGLADQNTQVLRQVGANGRAIGAVHAAVTTGHEALEAQLAEAAAGNRTVSTELHSLRQTATRQDETLAVGAAQLEALNRTLDEQLGKVDHCQTTLLHEVREGRDRAGKALETRGADLQQQLGTLNELLGRLDERLDRTSQGLDQALREGQRQDREATESLRTELAEIRRTVGRVGALQRVLQEQLKRVEAAVQKRSKAPVPNRPRTQAGSRADQQGAPHRPADPR